MTIHSPLTTTEQPPDENVDFPNKFQQLFSQIPAIIFSAKGQVTHINSAGEEAIGIPYKNIIGKTLQSAGFKVLDEQNKPLSAMKQPWREAITNNKTISNIITCLLIPDGTHRWHQSTSMPMNPSASGHPQSVIVTLTDITKHKETQRQLQQSCKMEAIGSLTSGLVHDFNNILTSICTTAQLLVSDKNTPKEIYESIKDIENEALRGAELTKQLLLFSKPLKSKHKTTFLNERLKQLRELLRRTINKNIDININMNADPFIVSIDPTQFEQIILNLALNARDAMPSGGKFTINTSSVSLNKNEPGPISNPVDGLYARIDIIDNGIGIPANILPRIFEPFFTSKDKESGTGLGLAIVYAIIQQNGGYINVNSTAGKGTSFAIFLRAKHSHIQKELQKKTTSSPIGGYETILVVDDEIIITKTTSRLLERYGYKTLTAYDGNEAMMTFKKHKIDLVLMDMEMPGIGGQLCLKAMLEINPKAKVIMISGHIMKHQAHTLVGEGACAFIKKPFDSYHLMQVIRDTLNAK